MPEVLLKLNGRLRMHRNFRMASTRVPNSSRQSGPDGGLCSWGRRTAPLATASGGGPYRGVPYTVPGELLSDASERPLKAHALKP